MGRFTAPNAVRNGQTEQVRLIHTPFSFLCHIESKREFRKIEFGNSSCLGTFRGVLAGRALLIAIGPASHRLSAHALTVQIKEGTTTALVATNKLAP